MVALLSGDEDVVAQWCRLVDQSALGHIDDRLTIDPLGDRLAQCPVGQDRAGRAVEGHVIPAGARGPPDRNTLGTSGYLQLVQRGDAGGIDGVVL